MRRTPTIEEARRIMIVIDQVTWTPKDFYWGPVDNNERAIENKKEALALCYSLSGHKPERDNCHGCWTVVLNILREAINLPAVSKPVSDELKTKRMGICATCPAHHKRSNSCGRLILDAISPTPVTLSNGTTFNPCGCFLPAKTAMKHSQCPSGQW